MALLTFAEAKVVAPPIVPRKYAACNVQIIKTPLRGPTFKSKGMFIHNKSIVLFDHVTFFSVWLATCEESKHCFQWISLLTFLSHANQRILHHISRGALKHLYMSH